MPDAILEGQISTVLIAYKDRLSRVDFDLFNHLFEKFGCKIVVVSPVGSTQLDSQEVFEEIVSLLHCYSMKLYSARKRK
jgi:predicted site-specific integrase-resolvase